MMGANEKQPPTWQHWLQHSHGDKMSRGGTVGGGMKEDGREGKWWQAQIMTMLFGPQVSFFLFVSCFKQLIRYIFQFLELKLLLMMKTNMRQPAPRHHHETCQQANAGPWGIHPNTLCPTMPHYCPYPMAQAEQTTGDGYHHHLPPALWATTHGVDQGWNDTEATKIAALTRVFILSLVAICL
jgi:hypothetical protein